MLSGCWPVLYSGDVALLYPFGSEGNSEHAPYTLQLLQHTYYALQSQQDHTSTQISSYAVPSGELVACKQFRGYHSTKGSIRGSSNYSAPFSDTLRTQISAHAPVAATAPCVRFVLEQFPFCLFIHI